MSLISSVLQSSDANTTCVYWSEDGEGAWSIQGCTSVMSNSTQTVCSCTHLSSFALLRGIQENKVIHNNTVELLRGRRVLYLWEGLFAFKLTPQADLPWGSSMVCVWFFLFRIDIDRNADSCRWWCGWALPWRWLVRSYPCSWPCGVALSAKSAVEGANQNSILNSKAPQFRRQGFLKSLFPVFCI